jgi:hypothetical protein
MKELQISLTAQKNGKKVKVPILPDLLAALEIEQVKRNPSSDDFVLRNPATGKPYETGKKLYERCKRVGKRAGVANVRPHRFRDSFAADAFLRGCDTEEVAAYLADTVATVAEHYSEFIEARRKRADAKMRTGKGLVEFTGPQQPTLTPSCNLFGGGHESSLHVIRHFDFLARTCTRCEAAGEVAFEAPKIQWQTGGLIWISTSKT